MDFKAIQEESFSILNEENAETEDKLQTLCDYLKTNVPHYDWVGFYLKNGNKNELKLHQFAGEPTEHIIIPFGKGICGQVAESNSTLNVEDISAEDNYIACGINVKSELVVPLFVNGKNIGQIDIDSHQVNAFSEEDERFLEKLNAEVAKIKG